MQQEIWNIGGAYQSPTYILSLKEFLDKMKIHTIQLKVFDSHQNLIWNGGNPIQRDPMKKELFIRLVNTYNAKGIGFHLVFSNMFVEEKHLADARGNYILENCHREGNGVIVTSHTLAKYIRENYPKYKLIHSLTHCKKNVEYYLQYKDLYDVFVLPPNMNYDFEKLSELYEVFGGEKIELLVNDICYQNCPFEYEHYRLSSQAILEQDFDKQEELWDSFCSKHHKERIATLGETEELLKLQSVKLSNHEVDKLRDMGFSNFKLACRGISSKDQIREIESYILEKYGLKTPFHAYQEYFKRKA